MLIYGIVIYVWRIQPNDVYSLHLHFYCKFPPPGDCHREMNSHNAIGVCYITLKTPLQSQILISYLSLPWLFKGHGQPADVGARHSYRPS